MKIIMAFTLLLSFVSCTEIETNEKMVENINPAIIINVAARELLFKKDSLNAQKIIIESATSEEREKQENTMGKFERQIKELKNKSLR